MRSIYVANLLRRPRSPSFADMIMVGVSIRRSEVAGGDEFRDTPFAGAIIAGGVVAPLLYLVAVAVHAVRSAWAASSEPVFAPKSCARDRVPGWL